MLVATGKQEAHRRTAGVGPHGRIEKVAKPTESGDIVDLALDLNPLEAYGQTAQQDILIAARFIVESKPYVEQRDAIAEMREAANLGW